MIKDEKVIVMDIDGTICELKNENQAYESLQPKEDVLERLRQYKENGFYISLYSARNMRTHKGNIGLINAKTLKVLFKWLDDHQIPYDEVHVGKPWPGKGGFYVDDKAIRPDEFVKLTYEEILEIVGN